jgi:serine/threonine protein kinase/Tfp pilus assembly protein PilF
MDHDHHRRYHGESETVELRTHGSSEARSGSLASRQVEAMVAAWQRGERPIAEHFLARHPQLDSEAALRLIYEEVCLRQEAALEVDAADLVRRFPQWKAELEVLLDCHRLMLPQLASVPAAFPEVGEMLVGFRLVAELGRGASGRVFLATQPSLADRPVVLKVTPWGQEEHLSLARLQHMNIVPLYSEQVDGARGLRILCMPFLGGATLARILKALRGLTPARRTGIDLVEALNQVQAALPLVLPAQGSFRKYLGRAPYVQAVCWIGACLADGLQYAHDRGLVHMDIKPSNVLLTGDGQPMLLDFHLARGPLDPEEPMARGLGGTPDYASPEQRAAMAALRAGRARPATVDGRSDIYSLGVLLYEALAGTRPAAGREPVPLYRKNPQVSVGLSDLILKCLRRDPGDRYADAAALAADLRRHLNHLPLKGVPNRSPLERWHKWRRRRPSALPRSLIFLVTAASALAAAALFSMAYRQRVADIEAALGSGREYREHHQYTQAAEALRRGLALAAATPATARLKQALDEDLRLLQRNAKAAELHLLADLIRFRYGLAPKPSEETRTLLRRGQGIWDARALLVRRQASSHAGDRELERTIRTDLLDFVTVWADLHVRLAPANEAETAHRDALRWLDEAIDLLGPSPALVRLKTAHARALGIPIPDVRTASQPESAWNHCDLGRSYLHSGELVRAAAEFQTALEIRPQDFWPNFYQGLCAYQLGRFADAINAFRVCVALAPETAECYYNRALAHEALGDKPAALRDYTRALQLDRGLSDAALNRGLLLAALGRHSEATADLDQALATARGREARALIQYNRGLIALSQGDRASAVIGLEAAVSDGHAEAENVLRRLRP